MGWTAPSPCPSVPSWDCGSVQRGGVCGCVTWRRRSERPCSFPTVVVKAVSDLVPDHHPDAPEVQGLWLFLAEERRLQDPSGEHCSGTGWGTGPERAHLPCARLGRAPAIKPRSPGGRAPNGPMLQTRKLRSRGREARASAQQIQALPTVLCCLRVRGVRPPSLRPRPTTHRQRRGTPQVG